MHGRRGLQCYVPPGCTTTLSGTVYDPAGANPLYNVVVFIPNDPNGALTPIKQGTNTCNTCDVSIGDYVTATTSGPDGKFTLTGVPATTHVPLVVQIGKWRREVFLLAGESLHQQRGPRLVADAPPCEAIRGRHSADGSRHRRRRQPRLLPQRGRARPERVLGAPCRRAARHLSGAGRGRGGRGGGGGSGAPGLSSGGTAGNCTSDNPACVWNSKANLEAYDIVLLACEGDTYDPAESMNTNTNKTTSSKQALHDWLDEGGKVFATHFHYTWFKNGPADFQGVATWLGNSGGQDNALYDIDTSFFKGMVLQQVARDRGRPLRQPDQPDRRCRERQHGQRADAAVDLQPRAGPAAEHDEQHQVPLVSHSGRRDPDQDGGCGRDQRAVLRQSGLQRPSRRREPDGQHPGRLRRVRR